MQQHHLANSPIVIAATFFSDPVDEFHAEARALEEAACEMDHWLQRSGHAQQLYNHILFMYPVGTCHQGTSSFVSLSRSGRVAS
jgi:hypothetical protein